MYGKRLERKAGNAPETKRNVTLIRWGYTQEFRREIKEEKHPQSPDVIKQKKKQMLFFKKLKSGRLVSKVRFSYEKLNA